MNLGSVKKSVYGVTCTLIVLAPTEGRKTPDGRLKSSKRCFAIVHAGSRRKVVSRRRNCSLGIASFATSACIRVFARCAAPLGYKLTRQNGLPGATSACAPFARWTPLLLSRYFRERNVFLSTLFFPPNAFNVRLRRLDIRSGIDR